MEELSTPALRNILSHVAKTEFCCCKRKNDGKAVKHKHHLDSRDHTHKDIKISGLREILDRLSLQRLSGLKVFTFTKSLQRGLSLP